MTSSPRRAAGGLRTIILAGAALFAVAPAVASETITYSYDARGRLVKVVHSGNVNNGNTACYAYDKGDNRSNVTVATGSDCSSGGGGGGTAPSFAVGNDSSTEGTNVVFTITRSGTSTGSYSLSYATANGTAIAGSDYTAKSGTITFNDGIMSRNVAVATTDDTTVENSETFYLDISNPSGGATITDARGNGTITDNDSASTCDGVSFAVGQASVTEGGSLSFTVTKSGTTSDSCSVSYASADNSATAGSDYTATSGTLTFSSTQTSLAVSVPTTDDTTVENSETMYLNLSSPGGSATISDSQGIGTISDNDSTSSTCSGIGFAVNNASANEGDLMVFTVTKTGATSVSCSVSYATADGTAIAPNDYGAASGVLTFSSSQTSLAVSITTTTNVINEGTETFYLNLSSPSTGATITDSQGAGTLYDASDGGGCTTCLQSTDPEGATTDATGSTTDEPPTEPAAPPPEQS